MGIRGLLKFIETYCEDACEPVNIPDIAQKYKQETGLDPVIALDISSCIREIYKMNNINWLDAERFKIFEKAVNKFLKSFTSHGIKFFVVFDGVVPETKLPVWLSRKKFRTKTFFNILKTLENNNSHETLIADDDAAFILPPGAYTVLESIFQSNKNCICRYSVLEADEELANYAVNNNCFAYLTADSDFVIYDGAKYCLSIRDLDLKSMTTINFNREVLAKGLKMHVAQLPVFALLCGNDVIPFDSLKYFHRQLCPRYSPGKTDYKFKAIANFVGKLEKGRDILKKLPEISKRIFGSDEYTSRLEAGLKNYWGDLSFPGVPETGHENWDQILEKCYENHVTFSFDLLIYNVIFGYSVKLGPLLEKVNDENLPPSALTTLPLRQKLYGVLLYEKPNHDEIYIEEWLAFNVHSLDTPFKIKPQFIEHPGLLTLWNENDQSPKTMEARWRTFCKAISPKLKYQEIMALPKNLTLPILALYYLNNELKRSREKLEKQVQQQCTFKLEYFEIKALLAQVVVVNKLTIEEIDEIIKILEIRKDFWNLDTKALHLGSNFQNICRSLYSLSVACGNLISRSDASALKYFDGKLFMRIYDIMQEGAHFDIWKYFKLDREIRESYENCLSLIMNVN